MIAKIKAYAKILNAEADNFSAQEKVAYKILDLIEHAHPAESILETLQSMLSEAQLEQDEQLIQIIQQAIDYMLEHKEKKHVLDN